MLCHRSTTKASSDQKDHMNAFRKIRRCLYPAAVILTSSLLGLLASSASAIAGPTILSFKELDKGATVHFVDTAPAAKLEHGTPFFSPGNELVTTIPLAMEGKRVGKIRAICIATTSGNTRKPSSSNFICNGIARRPGGSLILAGEAGEGVTEGAVTGGTGIYAGARGSVITQAGRGGSTTLVTFVE
jgi:hypothetical protein